MKTASSRVAGTKGRVVRGMRGATSVEQGVDGLEEFGFAGAGEGGHVGLDAEI